jgi:hypothetical protein
VENFGLKEGFKFWFRWNFRDPIDMFIWLNITHKPYCTYSGFHCKNKECTHKHLKTKKQIKSHWKKTSKEMQEVKTGKGGMCNYCSQEKATVVIPNPNFDEINSWAVCVTCKKIIETQQKLSFGEYLMQKPHGEKLGKMIVKDAKQELSDLSYESDKQVFSVEFKRK